MTTEQYRDRLRISTAAHDWEIEQNLLMCDAELARVGINVNATAEYVTNLLDYARDLFLKAEFNFDGRGETYAAKFEAVRDAMKLSSAFTQQEGGGDGAGADPAD